MKDRQLTNFTLYPAQSHYNPVQKKIPEAFEKDVEENPGKARIGNAVEPGFQQSEARITRVAK
jgi:hypothetical protein